MLFFLIIMIIDYSLILNILLYFASDQVNTTDNLFNFI